MNELFREIEEDIRRERFDKLWHGFGKVMVGVSIAIVLATIGIVILQNHKQSQAMEQTAKFIKGIDRLNIEDYKSAIPIFGALAENDSSTYYGIVMLRKAQAENALSLHDDASNTYRTLARHDPVFGGLAMLLVPAEGDALIEPVKNSPFYYTQSEWKGWQLLQKGKKDEAVMEFLALYENPATPRSIHERMAEVLQHIAPDKMAEKMAQKIADAIAATPPETKVSDHE